MRKRKDSHDGSPVGDTNILFVPDSSADPSASGVDALMGMIDEAGAPPWVTPASCVQCRRNQCPGQLRIDVSAATE